MNSEFQFFPDSASTLASEVDLLFWFFMLTCGGAGFVVFSLVAIFAVQFRRRRADELPAPPGHSTMLEIGWSVVPFVIVMTLFVWGARIYVRAYQPPEQALEIFVVGKQWMWKVQHANGAKEINELHVPVNQPVKLVMTSEDVIHSFYVPAFRIKKDVVPGRYTSMWFEATKPGVYHLFCAEYCGTEHSLMTGKVHVMSPSDYHDWLSESGSGPEVKPMKQSGEELFSSLGCQACHLGAPGALCPNLKGVFGARRPLAGGGSVVADESYMRESILYPAAKMVEGYPPVMPSFDGRLTEEELTTLISYIKSLSPEPASEEAP